MMSLRARLTLFYGALLTGALLVSGALAEVNWQRFLLDSTVANMRTQAQPVIQRVTHPPTPPKPPDRGAPPPPKPPGLPEMANALARELPSPNLGVRILNHAGDLLAQDSVRHEIDLQPPIEQKNLLAILHGQPEVHYTVQGQSERLMVVLLPLELRSEITGVVQLTSSLGPADAVLSQQRINLVLAIAATLLVGTLAGTLFTRAALRPLQRVVAVTQRIAAGDLSQRANLGQRKDEIGQLAASFDQMLDSLEKAFAAQRQFVADASHELRTPLTALKGSLEVLMRGALNDANLAQPMLRSMHRESERMSRLVLDLLTLSRLDAHPTLQRTQVDLQVLCEEVAEQIRLLAQPGQTIICEANQAMQVQADGDRLRQVLLNLGENAIKFSPADGQIRFSLMAQGSWAVLQVTDTGIGLTAEEQAHIFERFYRADKARTRGSRERGGFGLGLAIAQAVVQAHHGRIEVRSTVGQGSEFRVWLPSAAPSVLPGLSDRPK